jgi:nucleotide-binding universal stress UspA family protein
MKVLLAIDSCDSYVVEYAASRNWPADTVFCVMSVADLRNWEGLPELVDDAKRAAVSIAQCAARKLGKSGLNAFPKVPVESPKEAIIGFAELWNADLILVGSHGRGAMARFLLGSVAQSVLRGAHCAVELVRRPPESRASKQGTQILLAAEGSECSGKAVAFVANHSWPANSTVRILSVAELAPADIPSFATQYSTAGSSLVDNIIKRAQTRAKKVVENARQILTQTGVDICDATPVGDPRTIILEEAKACDADLIVLGSHGGHGIGRLLTGSVSEAVAAHANCSVAIVR